MSTHTLRATINIWSRRLHRWGSIAAMLPLLVVITTGLLLLLKKELAWVQPPLAQVEGVEIQGSPLSMNDLLDSVRSDARSDIDGWHDVRRIDYRPRDGVIKIIGTNSMETQVSARDGSVIQVARRRSDLIESLHDGSWFHRRAKYLVFLPSALVLLGLWITGVYLFMLPHLARRERVRRARTT